MSAAFGESLHAFLDFLASERRASRHTVSAYRRDLAQLSAFMIENPSIASLLPYTSSGLIVLSYRGDCAPRGTQSC